VSGKVNQIQVFYTQSDRHWYMYTDTYVIYICHYIIPRSWLARLYKVIK
jgi:hypothetical protein